MKSVLVLNNRVPGMQIRNHYLKWTLPRVGSRIPPPPGHALSIQLYTVYMIRQLVSFMISQVLPASVKREHESAARERAHPVTCCTALALLNVSSLIEFMYVYSCSVNLFCTVTVYSCTVLQFTFTV